MIHTYTSKGRRRYRYYVCTSAQKQGWDGCPSKSIPALEIEQFVVKEIQRTGHAGSAPQFSEEAPSTAEQRLLPTR